MVQWCNCSALGRAKFLTKPPNVTSKTVCFLKLLRIHQNAPKTPFWTQTVMASFCCRQLALRAVLQSPECIRTRHFHAKFRNFHCTDLSALKASDLVPECTTRLTIFFVVISLYFRRLWSCRSPVPSTMTFAANSSRDSHITLTRTVRCVAQKKMDVSRPLSVHIFRFSVYISYLLILEFNRLRRRRPLIFGLLRAVVRILWGWDTGQPKRERPRAGVSYDTFLEILQLD